MPTMYRLGCFRDDIVFLVYVYQRWIYRVDPTRVNEFGTTGLDPMGQDPDPSIGGTDQANGGPPPAAVEDGEVEEEVPELVDEDGHKVTKRGGKKEKEASTEEESSPKTSPAKKNKKKAKEGKKDK